MTTPLLDAVRGLAGHAAIVRDGLTGPRARVGWVDQYGTAGRHDDDAATVDAYAQTVATDAEWLDSLAAEYASAAQ